MTTDVRAAVDNSAWDGNMAMGMCHSAADYRSICAGEHTTGTPDQRQHWALPHHGRPGAPPNAAGVRNSLSRLPQTQNLANAAAAKAHLQAHMRVISPGANSAPADGEYRTVPFDLAGTDVNGDGLTFSGYAAVYNTPARIDGWEGEFDEQIAPGAFRAVAAGQYPVLMFEHGRHPLIGTMPLGRITSAREDSQGLFIEARLTDNWLIQPVRDAVADQALDGMSFRFTVDDGGETWLDRTGDVALRTLTSVSVPELGPVVFPAYEPTTASVRSLLDQFDKLPEIGRPAAGARAASIREGGAGQRPPQSLHDRYRGDGEALALRGIRGVRIG
jgi:HK97 family phage prohead protease